MPNDTSNECMQVVDKGKGHGNDFSNVDNKTFGTKVLEKSWHKQVMGCQGLGIVDQ